MKKIIWTQLNKEQKTFPFQLWKYEHAGVRTWIDRLAAKPLLGSSPPGMNISAWHVISRREHI